MRIWDIEPRRLCRVHLLGEHCELHALWTILTQGKRGYAHHPETKRWEGKLKALYGRHSELVEEMRERGYRHNSPLDARLAVGEARQNEFVDSIREQVKLLRDKGCRCDV